LVFDGWVGGFVLVGAWLPCFTTFSWLCVRGLVVNEKKTLFIKIKKKNQNGILVQILDCFGNNSVRASFLAKY